MNTTLAEADTYFENHLLNINWSGLPESDRTGALAMAEQDIAFELGINEINTENDNQLFAVYEQAVFLAVNRKELVRLDNIESEDIEGLGDRTYRNSYGRNPIAPRAMMFVKRIQGMPRFRRG